MRYKETFVPYLALIFALVAFAWPAAVAHAHVEFENDRETCEVVVDWNDHGGIRPTWEHTEFWGTGKLNLNVTVNVFPFQEELTGEYGFSYETLNVHELPARFSLRDQRAYHDNIGHRNYWWRANTFWYSVHGDILAVLRGGFNDEYNGFGKVPDHCLLPPPPLCKFVGGFGDLVQRTDVGTCHGNELPVAGGALQSADKGILFYSRDNPRLDFFTWERVWQTLNVAPSGVTQPSHTTTTYIVPVHRQCHYAGGFAQWVRNSPATGNCYNNEQHVVGGAVQSTANGILFYSRVHPRLEFFTWDRAWHALATAQAAATPQSEPAAHTQAVTPAPAVPAASHCRFVFGFADWVGNNPEAGACHNNELYVTGGSIQSTQNGILFYDGNNQRLGLFNWAQVWQAVATLPFSQPQLPASAGSQGEAHCQYLLGFANWVGQHADTGHCLNNEQFLANGSVQSTQNGILFYDRANQRLGFFSWEQVWQGLARLDIVL